MREYFRKKFKQHIKEKIRLRDIIQPNSHTSLMRKKIIERTSDLGATHSNAMERLKAKLEEKALNNYEKVLDDIRG